MCGINGIFAYNASASLPSPAELIATRDHMRARGPDGAGVYWSEDRRLGLGHRRLSILDLSDRAAQPMTSADGRYQVTFNGEIYNYPALKMELEAQGVEFRTGADTEILLHLYARAGGAMVHQLRGMFAFAIWDNVERELFLARDPYGIKPLYIAWDGWTFRFASQVKALLAGGKVSCDPEPAGIVGFYLWGSVPEPFTLYREIRSLPAGHTQLVDAAGPRAPKPYASIAAEFAARSAQAVNPLDAAAAIGAAAAESVSAHLLADVEVGLFLSAGIDSGAILGLMRDAGQAKIRAITLSFEEFRGTQDDEVPLAALMAQQYGAEHFVRLITQAEYEHDLPLIVEAMDQPSIDGINSWFVAKASREEGLKVALSGVGGDELFAGYPSFVDIPKWVNLMKGPAAVPGLGSSLRRLGILMGLDKTWPKGVGMVEYGGSYAGAYLLRRGLFLPFELRGMLDPDLIRMGMARLMPIDRMRATVLQSSSPSASARVSAMESSFYMRNQLLRDIDWSGMAHSIEIRSPLVDFNLLQAVAPLVSHLPVGKGKEALANAPLHRLPDAVVTRKKTGFSVPSGYWNSFRKGQVEGGGKGSDSRMIAMQLAGQFIGTAGQSTGALST